MRRPPLPSRSMASRFSPIDALDVVVGFGFRPLDFDRRVGGLLHVLNGREETANATVEVQRAEN